MKLSNLATVLRAAGLTVVETPGWKTRGYTPPGGQPIDMAEVRGVLWHHTATNRSAFSSSNAPTLNMCTYGRSDPWLPGPLCNIVFGRDGTCYLVAAGLANHAGRGSAAGIPDDMGNYYLIGIEMESSGILPWDWTLDQLRVAPHLGAALERAYLQDQPEELRLQLAHYEYSSEGKIDPAGWPGEMDGLRASINKVLSGTITTQSTGVNAPAPTIEKEPEMPVSDRVDSIFKARHRIPQSKPKADKPYTLSVKDDGAAANFAVNGVGHYAIKNYVRGEGLLTGQRIEAQFFISKGGKVSGHFVQDIKGSEDGKFNQPVLFDRKVEAGTTITCVLKSLHTENAYLTGFGAEVTTWKAA